MAVSDTGFQVANLIFPLVRRRLNEILLALTTNHYAAGDPPVMVPFMTQVTEIDGKLTARVRNAANNGWVYNVFGGSAAPSGSGMDFFGDVLPDGWLWRDGSKYNQTVYPNLFAAIGTRYNIGGEGAGEFRVPDDRDRVTVGSGLTFALGAVGGEKDVQILRAHLPNYQLPLNDGGHNHTYSNTFPVLNGGGIGGTLTTDNSNTSPLPTSGEQSNITVALGGGGQQINNLQPYMACNKIIKI